MKRRLTNTTFFDGYTTTGESDTTVLLDYTGAGGWNVLPDFAPQTITEPAGNTPRTDAARISAWGEGGIEGGIGFSAIPVEFCRQLERELAAAQAQRDKAIAHLVNMLHAADELADCVGIIKWDTEIYLARIFLKECGK